ncbi:MAG: ComEC/Rec2 family competence protein [Candidatus Levybacteria bacterium]|nr:ComEC/Rec2 family competence protein [Candidatus Levybacteria bacterium]
MQYINYFIGILLLLLAFRFQQFYQSTSKTIIDGQQIKIHVTLLTEPKIVGSQQKFVVIDDGQTFFIVTPRYPAFHYGDALHIFGTVKKRVLTNENQVLSMYYPKIEASKKEGNFVLAPIKSGLAITSTIRQKVTLLFQNTLPSQASSLLLGITFGIKAGMTSDFFEKLKATGVLHVIAASGMNVTMVGGFLSSLFAVLFRRQIAILASIGGIVFYAALAGFEPSIVRASIMGILAFTAQILGRQYLATYALVLAAAGMLFLNPQLLFDIGFQLSFLATLGLIYIRPLLPGFPDLQTTIAAQIATLPILLANFGTYSLFSVLVNALVLWTVPVLMIIGGVGGMVGLVFEPMGRLILYASLPFLLYFEYVVNLFSNFGTTIAINSFPWQWVAGYYCLLIVIVLHHAQKSRSY